MKPRDLGVPFGGTPGPFNAITDVPGVRVGVVTLVEGDFVRTGVTAILPRPPEMSMPCFAGTAVLNGNGEITGTHWIRESGFLDGPILITNTHSVGVARDAVIAWQISRARLPATNRFGHSFFSLPVVAETADLRLNDMNGFHIRPEHIFAALDSAKGGHVAEGNVGGGTGMICHGWKGGTGTSSRRIGEHSLGVLVQANHGSAARLTIAGVPVGELLAAAPSPLPAGAGSIIAIVATDAPLLPHQLNRIALRVALGIGRVGGLGENSSGDLFLAFSTAPTPSDGGPVETLGNRSMDPYFAATVDATEEAIVNALFAAKTMSGNGVTVEALPKDRVLTELRRRQRLTGTLG